MQPLLLCTSNSFHVFWFLQGMLGLGRCFWIVSAPERSLRWPLLPLGKWREHYFKTGQLCVITASNNDRLLWSHYKTGGSAKVFIIDQMWESGVCLMSLEGCGIWEERLIKGFLHKHGDLHFISSTHVKIWAQWLTLVIPALGNPR